MAGIDFNSRLCFHSDMAPLSLVQRPLRTFISYSHHDKSLLIEFHAHLSPLRRTGLITTWYDRAIEAGSAWKGTIDAL
jgi:hypothetical protein